MLRIGCDLDGVVADFRTAFLDVATKVLGRQAIQRPASPMPDLDAVSPSDAKRVWKAICDTPNWWLGLAPYEPAQIARLYQLARRFRWEVSFLTSRIPTAGDSVQFQSQTWLEAHGFYMPAVVTVPGSRGDIANALRLDVVIDDQYLNCLEVIGASQAKAMLMLHMGDKTRDRDLGKEAADRGIGVVFTLEEAIGVLLQLQDILPQKRGSVMRLADWFSRKTPEGHVLPMNPRTVRPVPPVE
jgi:5' nucleotidase, deoxy (Pyrimidine), cytosolic type C protein (NT5C)